MLDTEIVHLIGYHGTTTKSKYSIDKYGFDPKMTKKRENHWLGQGVYFFCDCTLAEWWALNAVEKEEKKEDGLIYSVDINVDKSKFADLDDYDTIKVFWKFLLDLISNVEQHAGFAYKIEMDDQNSIEKIRGVFFDQFKIENGYEVLKKTFVKSNAKYVGLNLDEMSLNIIKKFAKTLNVYVLETQYCVSNKKHIKNAKCIKTIPSKYKLEVL